MNDISPAWRIRGRPVSLSTLHKPPPKDIERPLVVAEDQTPPAGDRGTTGTGGKKTPNDDTGAGDE